MSFYETISGARMHASFFRPGGISRTFHTNFLQNLLEFSLSFNYRINEIESLLSNNRI
jgi:NADH dehydrogenase (ubiquinone) Fe-S protein 2